MKRRKLVGITIIVTSILMQIVYATSTGQMDRTVRTKELAVEFLNNPTVTHDEHIQVRTMVDKGRIDIVADNLYPGGKFGVTSTVANKGEYDAIITGVELVEKQGEGLSHELFTTLVGYEENQSIDDYNTYLHNTYVDQVIEVGEVLNVPLVMGIPMEETGLQNQATQFSLLLQFKQREGGSSGSNGGNETDKEPDQDKVTPDKGNNIPSNEVVPEEEITLPEDETPPVVELEMSPEEITPVEEVIPSKGGLLPKTGGVTPMLMYGLGIVLLGSGIMIYRKKEE